MKLSDLSINEVRPFEILAGVLLAGHKGVCKISAIGRQNIIISTQSTKSGEWVRFGRYSLDEIKLGKVIKE